MASPSHLPGSGSIRPLDRQAVVGQAGVGQQREVVPVVGDEPVAVPRRRRPAELLPPGPVGPRGDALGLGGGRSRPPPEASLARRIPVTGHCRPPGRGRMADRSLGGRPPSLDPMASGPAASCPGWPRPRSASCAWWRRGGRGPDDGRRPGPRRRAGRTRRGSGDERRLRGDDDLVAAARGVQRPSWCRRPAARNPRRPVPRRRGADSVIVLVHGGGGFGGRAQRHGAWAAVYRAAGTHAVHGLPGLRRHHPVASVPEPEGREPPCSGYGPTGPSTA